MRGGFSISGPLARSGLQELPEVEKFGGGRAVAAIAAPLLPNIRTRGKPHGLDSMLDLCT